MINRRNFNVLSKPTLFERFKLAFSLVERAPTGTLLGLEMTGALTLVLRVCTAILFVSIKHINM